MRTNLRMMQMSAARGWKGAVVAVVAGALVAVAVVASSSGTAGSTGSRERRVLIFAAASLQTVLDELTPDIGRALNVDVRTSYAATSALARQIENGAPADLFVSADREWMDYLAARHQLRPDSQVDLVGNRLVLIAPADRVVTLAIGQRFGLARALGADRLAIADPDTVPAGRYARAALTSLGVWDDVAGKIAPAENVRAALVLVARGESPYGIVYRTDALAEPKVRIVGVFPDESHPPIVYPAALTLRASPDGARVLAQLRSSMAAAVFVRHGFLALH